MAGEGEWAAGCVCVWGVPGYYEPCSERVRVCQLETRKGPYLSTYDTFVDARGRYLTLQSHPDEY